MSFSAKKRKIIIIFTFILAIAFILQVQMVSAQDAADNSDDYLHVSGNKIFDKYGNQVRLTGIAWFGFETPNECYHGIWSQKMEFILDTAADNGFNLLRVPLSLQLVNQWRKGIYPQTTAVNIFYNPGLEGLNTLEILDASIAYCKKIGLKVMLDMHRTTNSYQTGLWYGNSFTAEDFEASWKWLAEHYKNDDTVIAMDLFNEPYGKPTAADGAKWDGSTDKNNWKYEAEKVGKAILDINPNLLIVVEGVETYPYEGYTYAEKDEHKYYYTWWGGNLRGVRDYPVNLGSRQSQLVYSPHDYGPSVWMQSWFQGDFNKDTLLRDVWGPNWYYINGENIAPVLVGEWGGRMDKGINEKWMTALTDFIEDTGISHTFWCLNSNSADTGGIFLGNEFNEIDMEKLALVQRSLWKNTNGKFIGLDHKINLGKTGTHVGAGSEIQTGDVNSDGNVNALDLAVLKMYLLGGSTSIDRSAADMNSDGSIDAIDMILLKQLLLGK
ncbi:cellulase family glycosylhydrolase [Ruminiclostridium cellobioparum]|uniref:cellulase n=1 Tax=Ruminiclostridium cellobioparum subsp. termitidis CT1112 TaxID=1195236 RepID=S0FNL0_RUMCE|nr:cellulase family glycosylhydrolase [Ruminiclostridium cellobioparum]EMS73472.1 Endoglucanase [Ruminiclostridium cellobioparum subsp. termitidis CT1112]